MIEDLLWIASLRHCLQPKTRYALQKSVDTRQVSNE